MSLRFTLHDSSKKKTELSNLCGLAQVPAVPLSCFHMVAEPSDPEGEGQTLREVAVICERSTLVC